MNYRSSFRGPANANPQLILPNCSEVFAAQNLAGRALPLAHLESAKLRLAQMAQLRRNACLRVMREMGELVKRQPGAKMAGAQQDHAKHVALAAPACHRRQAYANVRFHPSSSLPHVPSSSAAGYFSAGNPSSSISSQALKSSACSSSSGVPAVRSGSS
jgi:hypothetical protein